MVIHYTSTLCLILCISSIILLLSSSHAQAQTFKYCDKNEHYALKVSGVDISPVPPVKGERLYFKIAAYARGEPITSGVLLYEISYAGTPPIDSMYVHDLYKETSCPVHAGNFVVAHKRQNNNASNCPIV